MLPVKTEKKMKSKTKYITVLMIKLTFRILNISSKEYYCLSSEDINCQGKTEK